MQAVCCSIWQPLQGRAWRLHLKWGDKMEKKKNVVDNTKVEETNNEGFDELTTEDRLVSIEKKVNATCPINKYSI